MINSHPICIIGGYDSLSYDYYNEIKKINKNSIFINLNKKYVKKNGFFNINIFKLKEILLTLSKHKIKNILFIGKINRPNLSDFKYDGEIEKYLPILLENYKRGDGFILSAIIKIFRQKGFLVISPKDISSKFFINKNKMTKTLDKDDKLDIKKSVKILEELSKYDNAQSLVISNGYILGIEAAEGTDNLLKRVFSIRKSLDELKQKSGFLVKLPKKNQSMLIDLPVIGPKTIKLIIKANLRGIAIDSSYTIIHNKEKILQLIRKNDLKLFNIAR